MRSHVAESGMFSIKVVGRDVISNHTPGCSMVLVFGHFELRVECSKTRFHERVVIAVVGPVHALSGTCPARDRAIAATAIRTTAIGVMDHHRFRPSDLLEASSSLWRASHCFRVVREISSTSEYRDMIRSNSRITEQTLLLFGGQQITSPT